MSQILTVTLNPALDLATSTDRVMAGPKLRCSAPVSDPGGGGINVSRAIRHLGGDSMAFVAVGGSTGMRLTELLTAEGQPWHAFAVPGETRQSLAVTDAKRGEQYRFVMPGPIWDSALVQAALTDIATLAPAGGFLVLSGSNPPGVPDDFAAMLAAAAGAKQQNLILDTSGPALAEIASKPSGAFLLRMDEAEATDLAGRQLLTRRDSAEFAASLVARGVARHVIIARGPDGSVIATPDARYFAPAAKVPVVSRIGAGDSFVGGFTMALAQGATIQQALSQGTAAASAAVMTPATELCRAQDVARLLADCPASPI